MTRILKDYLGAEKVIWLIAGLGLDKDPTPTGMWTASARSSAGRLLLHGS